MLREKLRNRKGFTLIEIIVVIVILAVLMAVAVPSVMSYMSEGNSARYESVARAALINTQTAVAKDYAEKGKLGVEGETDPDGANAIKWIQGAKENGKTNLVVKYGSQKSYGSKVNVIVKEIKLNSTHDDVVSAKYYISLDYEAASGSSTTATASGSSTTAAASGSSTTATATGTYREVDVTVNGKVNVAKDNAAR